MSPRQCEAEGCLTHYDLLLLILMVPQAHLHFWYSWVSAGRVRHMLVSCHSRWSYNGTESKLRLPCNLYCNLESYLWLHYATLPLRAKEDIIASVNVFLDI